MKNASTLLKFGEDSPFGPKSPVEFEHFDQNIFGKSYKLIMINLIFFQFFIIFFQILVEKGQGVTSPFGNTPSVLQPLSDAPY